MKKLVVSLLSAALAGLMFAVPAAGQNQSLFYGEYHNYSVTFKEDGEAVVFAKLVFTNSGDSDLNSYNFKAKGTELKEMAILQVKLPQECAEYSQIYDSKTGTNKCARYRDPDYNSYYYYSFGSAEEITYRSAKFEKDGLNYKVALPDAVKPDKTSALLLAYTSTDYAKNNFLAKSYDFPTLAIGNRITEAKVGVSVDEGLILEGVSTPTYCTMGMCPIGVAENTKLSTLGDASSISSAPVTNRSLDNLYASIGRGQRTYQAKSIAPDKSFMAEGRYAKSTTRLNAQKLLMTFVGVGVLVLMVVVLSLKLKNKSSKNVSAVKGKWVNLRMFSNMIPLASFLPMASLIAGTWYLSTDSFSNNIWATLNNVSRSLLVFFTILVYILLIGIAPTIYGVKKGWRGALSVIIMQAVWATFLLAITLPIIIFVN